jgi:Rrf2 family iron-sulfur cluster assembly transcriptional regulator
MNNLIGLSESAVLALHAAALLAGSPDRLLTTREMAGRLSASEATLAKALLELRRAGIIKTTRGPAGGSELAATPGKINLRQICEAIDGPMNVRTCLFSHPVCGNNGCGLNGFVESMHRQIAETLEDMTLADFQLEPRLR